MKIKQGTTEFTPITIQLTTSEEALDFWELLDYVAEKMREDPTHYNIHGNPGIGFNAVVSPLHQLSIDISNEFCELVIPTKK